LCACLWPDQPERIARLEAEMALAAAAPRLLLQGDAVEVMPGAFARVPADALPVVTTTWALSHFPLRGTSARCGMPAYRLAGNDGTKPAVRDVGCWPRCPGPVT